MKKILILNLFFLLNLTIIFSQNIDYQILKDLNKYQSPSDNRFNQFISDAAAPLSNYPSDVLVGAILGSGTAWLTWKINKKLQKKKQAVP